MTRIDDPHVVAALDVGDHEGRVYAVLELCDAALDTWRVGQPWTVVLDRLLEAGRGLAAVHAAGYVHRDVKPENILVKSGVAKLADFGMAVRPGWSARIGGTPGYIAPEAADGRQDLAGDVFAFACTAWACVLGRLPFGLPPASADSSAATLYLVERAREGAFDDRDIETDVPAAILAVLRSGLRADPDRRPGLDSLLQQLDSLRTAGTLGRWFWARRLGAVRATRPRSDS